MPRGTQHTLTGTLRWTRQGYALEREEGGVWQLDIGRNCKRYLNQKVTVTGTRADFDLIDVDTVKPMGGPTTSTSLLRSICRLLRKT